MKTLQKIFFFIGLFFCFGIFSVSTVNAQSFGFNVHSLASDSPENISSILQYLSQNCQTNIVRFWGFENRGGYDNIQKVLDAAPAGMKFVITLEDFPYGPPELNPKAWFSNVYKVSFRPYVQRVVTKYANNSKILAWEIMNEPHCKGDQSCVSGLVNFMNDISTLIRSIDSSSLVSPGMMALNHVGEEFGNGYDKVTSLPNITSNSCHFYYGNPGNCLTALQITKNKGKYFYVGEAGYKGSGSGSEGSCTSAGCQNVCDISILQNRANIVQSNLSQLVIAGANAFIVWQFSPEGSPLLICDKFSVFPHDPICEIDGSLPYNPPPVPRIDGCDLNNPGTTEDQKTSRPVPCEKCNQGPLTNSCATSFTVTDKIWYKTNEGANCSLENSGCWVTKDWGGTITVDPSSTEIPFVGKKGEEDENKYLADYFEGTGFYYSPPYDLSKKEDIERVFKEGGVWRKLATKEMQDQMKKAMVQRVYDSKRGVLTTGIVRDYLVSYKDDSAKISEFRDHLPPPDADPTYNEWLTSKWGKLWPAVPMFSREDTQGQILAYLGQRPGMDQPLIPDSETSKENQIEKVPHLARLFEVTRAINQLLLPAAQSAQSQTQGQISTTAEKQSVLLASTEGSSSNNNGKVLLAQDTCSRTCNANLEFLDLPAANPGVYTFKSRFCIPCNDCSGISHLKNFVVSDSAGASGSLSDTQGYELQCPTTYDTDWGTGYSPKQVTMNLGSTFTVSLNWSKASSRSSKNCCVDGGSASCTIKLAQNGSGQYVWESGCGIAPPPPPTCNMPPAKTVPECQKTSISDTGDTLCCGPINLKLQAKDSIKDNEACAASFDLDGCLRACGWTPNPDPELPPPDETCMKDCYDRASNYNREKSADVSRKVGVSLYHPYLTEIWQNSTESIKGFFNLFRPEQIPTFGEKDASSKINYGYTCSGPKCESKISSGQGDFYYPYLGGIQEAKNWVVQTLTSGKGTGSNPSQKPSSDNLGFSINIADTSINISTTTRARVIAAVKSSWSASKIDSPHPQNSSKLLFDYVVEKAVQSGWNPALVLAIWIEESGASGVPAYDFGCEAGNPNDFNQQLNCFLNLPYRTSGFEEFMCKFAEGSNHPCVFERAPNFPKNLKYWYDELVK